MNHRLTPFRVRQKANPVITLSEQTHILKASALAEVHQPGYQGTGNEW